MWELDHKKGWAVKNWCFQVVVLEKTLESPTARRSHQSVLKETNPEYSLDRLMLKLQYFGHLMRRANSLEKTLMLGKTEGRRRRGRQRMRWLDDITDSVNMNLSKQGSLTCYSPWGCKELDMMATEQQWLMTLTIFSREAIIPHLGECPVIRGSCNDVWICLSRHLDSRCRLQRFQCAKIIF